MKDPYSKPAYGLFNKLARTNWNIFWMIFFRISPKIFFRWRNFILKCFGAKIGFGCKIDPDVKIWAPWNLHCEDMVAIAAGVEIYNPSLITLGSHSILSQGAYLCGASHDYQDANFKLYSLPIKVGAYSWICARAIVMPGVVTGAGSVLGIASVATKELNPWSVYAGHPAKYIKSRVNHLS